MKNKVLIIAEAGVNHNGDLNKAKKLIEVAADAGVDYVKFQSFKASKLVSPFAKKVNYQKENMLDSADEYQYEMLKNLELTENNHIDLINHCNALDIKFFSTAFDVDGVDYLDSLGINLFKIPSGELTNFPYLKSISSKNKRTILSTGMANLDEINQALTVLLSNGLTKDKITILHCNSEYPTPMVDVNLKAMNTIGEAFGVKIGYSDHTLGIEVPIAAVALGATIIEKHFTLDRTLPGPDHKASLEPIELKNMVHAIRNIEKAISGSGKKEPTNSELKNIIIARKSIHLKTDLKKDEILQESHIIPLRPGDGISAINWKDVLGKKLTKDKKAFDKLIWSDLI